MSPHTLPDGETGPPELTVGTTVHDRDDAEPDRAVVVARPDATAEEWSIDCKHGDHTVASFPGNEGYPDDAPVAVVVFEDVLKDVRPGYDGGRAIPMDELARDETPFYAFPAPRLTPVAPEPEPDPELIALKDRLKDGGVDVEIVAAEGVVRAAKLGEVYFIHPDGRVEGDGALKARLEPIVREVLADG